MTHDPLCLCAEDESRCGHCWDDCACACFDIRRVRPVIVNAALDAAREAVAECFVVYGATTPLQVVWKADALAAIDALRGEA